MSTDDALDERSTNDERQRPATTDDGSYTIRLLGSLDVESRGVRAELGPPKQRALLALLALSPNEVVSTDRLIFDLWGEHAPRTARHSIQIYVSDLRKALSSLAGAPAISTRPPGYRLEVSPDAIDVHHFERLVHEARRAAQADDLGVASEAFGAALALWKGSPLSEFVYDDFAQNWVRRLHSLRLDAIGELARVEIEARRYGDALELIASAREEEPLREDYLELLMLALYRSGRHVDALREYEAHRQLLADELGVVPSPSLRSLQDGILRHADSLNGGGEALARTDSLLDTERPDHRGPGDGRSSPYRPRRWPPRFLGVAVATVAIVAALMVAVVARGGSDSPQRVTLYYSPKGELGDMISDTFDEGVAELGLMPRKVEDLTDDLESAAEGQDLVLVFQIDEDVQAAAKANPSTHFVVLDRPVAAENVTSIQFAEQEGSYLVGAAAALTSQTGTIGFLGGVDVDVIWHFQAGFEAGARAIDPDIKILTTYLAEPPNYSSGFLNPTGGERAARQLYEDGADIIFAAAGSSGLGVFEAAVDMTTPDRWLWAIGVDSDQYQTVTDLPGSGADAVAWRQHILTSMTKSYDVAIASALERFHAGDLDSGPETLGIADNGVGIAYSGGFIAPLRDQIDALRAQIADGEIDVPCRPADRPAATCD